MFRLLVAMIFFFIIIAGAVLLQIFLSKRQSRWPGLLIPFVSLLFSLIIVTGLCTFTAVENITAVTRNSDGTVVTEIKEVKTLSLEPSKRELLLQVLLVFLVTNIPTIISLAIYFACREKEKMNLTL